ncbi:C45 family autoproteolytic acyltransferase/hydrolase [Aestuariibius sp. 2305UL40-4]|uniref:C45 family autoproteolytic acyltransferase/hydolase n=1 Tax=Aestuariibius violaceus TaxID=3234132 RepID=UPI00345F0C2E
MTSLGDQAGRDFLSIESNPPVSNNLSEIFSERFAVSISTKKLQSRPTCPFDFWRLSLTGSQFEIGQQLAEFALKTLSMPPQGEDELSAAEERSLDDIFKTYCSTLSQRAEGVAALFADRGLKGNRYSLSIADQPPPFACSAASFASPPSPMLIRNFDFTLRSLAELVGMPAAQTRPMVDPVVLMKIAPDVGRQTISMVSMDLFVGAIDGINDAGFCAALLSLTNENAIPKTPRFDRFDELSIVRILIEQCASVSEAVELFRDLPKYTVFLPCHYIVADRHSDSAILEWDDKGAHIFQGTRGGRLVCTNHCVATPDAGIKTTRQSDNTGSVERYEQLSHTLQDAPHDRDAAWKAATLVRLNAFDAQADVFGGTLWSALYGLDPPSLEVRVLGQADDGIGGYNSVPIEYLQHGSPRNA